MFNLVLNASKNIKAFRLNNLLLAVVKHSASSAISMTCLAQQVLEFSTSLKFHNEYFSTHNFVTFFNSF